MRLSAERLADRGALKAQQKEPVRYGHKYAWLVCLVQSGTSWVAPEDMERIDTATTDTRVAAQQVKDLAVRNQRPKVITADSRYRDKHFLGAVAGLENAYALLRLQNSQKLSQAPVPKPKGSRGAPCKHGADLQLNAIEREPDAAFQAVGQTGRFRCMRRVLEGRWISTLQTSTLALLCRMYLWRFAIEHLFRFLKQHMGLNSHRSSNLTSLQRWIWIVALAYWQVLLMRDTVKPNRPAWHPHKKDGQVKPLTPAQVQRSAQAFLLLSGTPAANPGPAGKGRGRLKGFHPAPRKRFEVVFKTKRTQNQPLTC
jgi:hypothetical protein